MTHKQLQKPASCAAANWANSGFTTRHEWFALALAQCKSNTHVDWTSGTPGMRWGQRPVSLMCPLVVTPLPTRITLGVCDFLFAVLGRQKPHHLW